MDPIFHDLNTHVLVTFFKSETGLRLPTCRPDGSRTLNVKTILEIFYQIILLMFSLSICIKIIFSFKKCLSQSKTVLSDKAL